VSGSAFPRRPRLPPPPPRPRLRGWRAVVGHGLTGLFFAGMIYFMMVYDGALTVPAFRTPTPAHPYATEVKNAVVYLNAVDHWTLVLVPYLLLAAVGLIFFLAERNRRRAAAEKNAAARRYEREQPPL
jgi:hypothetical protein